MEFSNFAANAVAGLPAGLHCPIPSSGALSDNRRIVGGEKTDIKDHPWQVLLNVSGQVCGGSIVADRWVLTAAHCFFSLSGDRDFSKDTKNARAKTNVTDREFGTWTQIERIVVHKQYAPTARTYEYDLALVNVFQLLAKLFHL